MKQIILLLIFLATAQGLYAQTKVVQGVIKDKNGAVPGASVIEKDLPGNGASSDLDGKFKITLRGKSQVLVIRAVGYLSKEVNAGKLNQLNITIEEDNKALEEVVVVGYGTQKKATLTGAVSSVSGEIIRQNPSASLQNALVGRLPGFSAQQRSGQPGSDGATFYIRGVSSYTGSNQPLIIVDDIEFTYPQFARLDANEIESVNILKDASTTAIYGIKGANGVVLVTTRRGQISAPEITFRTEVNSMEPTKIPTFLGAYETAKLYNLARTNGGLTPYYTDADLEHWRTGDDPTGHPDVDWYKVLFRKRSLQWRNNLDIRGGNEKVKYFLSMGYINQNGMLNDFGSGDEVNNNFYYKRYNYRSNLDIKVTKTLDVRLDLSGNIGEQNSPNVPQVNGIFNNIFYWYNSFLTLSPFAYPIYNPNGSYGYANIQPDRYATTNIVGALAIGGYNRNYETNMNFNGSAVQRLDFLTKGLSLKGTVAYGSTYSYSRSMTRGSFPTFIYNTTTGAYTPRDVNISRLEKYSLGYTPGSTTRILNPQLSINYDNRFSNHHVYALGLYNQRTFLGYSDSNNANRVYNFVPSNSRGITGRVGYDYLSKYLVEFNGAYNGSDAFSKGNRFGFFPAASAGYNISEETFFKDNIKFVDRMKFRGSYGLVGSDDIGNYQYAYTQTYSSSGSASFGSSNNAYTAIYEGRLGNDNVSWEKEKKLDIGLEFSLFKGMITSTIDYFNNNRYDILTTRGTVSAIFGQNLPPVNLGKTNNKGYEIELAFNSKIGNDFTYNIKGNFSVTKNKIAFQDEPLALFPWQQYTGNSIGTPLQYTFIGYYTSADDIAKSAKPATAVYPGDLKYADLNGDGIINEADKSYFGYSNLPTTNFGLAFGGRYKSWSFNVLFQGATKFNVTAIREGIQAFSSNLQEIHTLSWTPETASAAMYPRLSLVPGVSSPDGYPSDFWNVRGDYLRLKNVQISYNVPQNFVNKVHLKAAQIYFTGTNLITWTKMGSLYQYDPEITSSSSSSNYPPQRMYNVGVSVTF